METNRYHRQMLLPQIGEPGQARLAKSRVLLVGCGALGSVIAEQLVRAGVGHLRIADRDLVELTNLQRQVLFDERDAQEGIPKAVAAANRLQQVNSSVLIEPMVVDIHAGNIEQLAGLEGDSFRADLILDGTDNVETRYLINDVAMKHGLPWVYGACVGSEGRVMAIVPGATPCLRCIFPEAPTPSELATCDTAGVLGPAAGVVASLQSIAAIKILAGHPEAAGNVLLSLDMWNNRVVSISTKQARREDCPACALKRYDFLRIVTASATTSLCGRNAIQIRPAVHAQIDLPMMTTKLSGAGKVEKTPYLLRFFPHDEKDISFTLFPDGRVIVNGTNDPAQARSMTSRFIGM